MSVAADWRALVFEAVGRVISFWGFKRNHGRLWALLYLTGEPLSAAEIVPCRSICARSVSPSTNSKAMKCSPASSPQKNTRAMLS